MAMRTMSPNAASPPAPQTAEARERVTASSSPPGERVDLIVSLTAGAEVWNDGSRDNRRLGMIEFAAILAAAVWPFGMMITGVTPIDTRSLVLAGVMVIAILPLLAPFLGSNVRSMLPRSILTSSVVRLTCAIVAIVCGAALLPNRALIGTWPLGVALGLDLVRTASMLGITIDPRDLIRRALFFPLHLGVLLGIVLVVWADPPSLDRFRLLALYLTGIGLTIVGTATITVANRELRLQQEWLEAQRRLVASSEFRSRGHWLHDDVCAELRHARLRLESGAIDPADVAAELDDLDHRLRLRQLDEFIGAGDVRVAEVVQPFLRRLQQQGVTIVESPTLDTAGRSVPGASARAIRRVLAVTFANSVEAGARCVALRLAWDESVLILEVEDDAGGNPDGALQPGRGLDGLANDLGAGGLVLRQGIAGLVVEARVRVTSPSDGAASQRVGGRTL